MPFPQQVQYKPYKTHNCFPSLAVRWCLWQTCLHLSLGPRFLVPILVISALSLQSPLPSPSLQQHP